MKVRHKTVSHHKVRYGSLGVIDTRQKRDQNKIRGRWYSIVKGWLHQNGHHFFPPIHRLKWKRAGESILKIQLSSVTPILSINLTDMYRCVVSVEIDEECWDIIYDSDIVPVQLTNGQWVCDMNAKAHAQDSDQYALHAHPSLADLVAAEMLMPLMNWVNRLHEYDWIQVVGNVESSSTWAKLVKHREEADVMSTMPINYYRIMMR